MLKALLKKQFLELNQFYFRDRKTGKARSGAGVVGMILLYLGIFVLLGFMLGAFENVLYQGLAPQGLAWLYWLLCALFSMVLGVFGSVFNTYAALYLARDNDLLLSMPIPPAMLLFARMTGVYATGLLYEAIVFVPAMVVPWLGGDFSAGALGAQLVLFFLVGVLILILTCALGWLVAVCSVRLKGRSFVTVLLSLAFIALYYIFYFKMSSYIQLLVANAVAVASTVRTGAWPLYALGLAATGHWAAVAVVFALSAALLAALMAVMSRSFLRIANASGAGRKSRCRRAAKARSARSALLHRELRRFTSSANYMLNCGLGLLLMPIVAVAALIKAGWLRETVAALTAEMPALAPLLPVLVAAALCLAAAMTTISAPSVALEGKTVWLLQSLPVRPREILRAKEIFPFLLAAPVVLLLGIVLSAVLRFDVVTAAAVIASALAFAALSDAFGLMLGLQKPNLSWTNETVPIKQSMAVMVTLFGGWALAVVLGLGGWALADILPSGLYLGGTAVLFAAAAWLCDRWIVRRGSAIFAAL